MVSQEKKPPQRGGSMQFDVPIKRRKFDGILTDREDLTRYQGESPHETLDKISATWKTAPVVMVPSLIHNGMREPRGTRNEKRLWISE
jgi:hypothetical protein